MTLIERRWAIRNAPEHQHERATCDVRTLPCTGVAKLYEGDTEVVPADDYRGAVGRISELETALDLAASDLRAEGHFEAAARAYAPLEASGGQ